METDPLLDTMAGNYRLVARLGAGGMGEVYKGVHATIGAKVAIKLLHAMAARDKSMQERFLLEARAVNRIDHPGVVKVVDAGRTEHGRPFLVMELLDGSSLHELRKAGKLSIAEACKAMIDVLDALEAAHRAGVIHRDLKPANVFQTRDGRTVVLDFGVAKLMAADSSVRLTMTGSAVGTPHYMAPEQIRGQPVTPSVDIYAAGVVLFELLCGRRPFDDPDDESVLAGHLERRPPPPRALEPAIPIGVQDVILAALQKEPEKRPPSAAAMRDALRAAIPGVNDATPSPAQGAWVPPPTPDQSLAAPTVAASPSARTPRTESSVSVQRPRSSHMRNIALIATAAVVIVGVILIVYAAKRSERDIAASNASEVVPPATVPIDAPGAKCTQLVTVDPYGVADAQQAAVKAAFFQRCEEDRWPVDVIVCFLTVTTAFDLARCLDGLTLEQRARLEAALPASKAADGLLSIQSTPPATITIDGVEVGMTPWSGRVPLRRVRVELAARGYQLARASLEVRADRANTVKLVLKKQRVDKTADPYSRF